MDSTCLHRGAADRNAGRSHVREDGPAAVRTL